MAKRRKSKKAIIPRERSHPGKIPKNTADKSPPAKGRKKPPQVNKRSSSEPGFPIVGIGASAGGLEAFKQLLEALPVDTGMAFVFVHHLDPTHESLAPEILSRSTRMPVHEVEEGMRALPNHVYIIPPNFNMALFHGELNLLPRKETRGQHLTIDSFFQSLAHDQKGRAIGVVLSGTASDGTQGIMAIKSEGGLVIVQEPKSAKFDGMPISAIASGVVDLILPPKDIAQELARISKHPYIAAVCETKLDSNEGTDEDSTGSVVESQSDGALRKIFGFLQTHTQVDFSNYKQTTLKRRIQRRMMVRKTESLESYAKYLQENPNEVQSLYADMLINVTEFFRDPNAFMALKDHTFPHLLEHRPSGAPIRIWVAGCSTGEEVYSLAIMLSEFLGARRVKMPIQILATDISESAIQKARAGIYSEGIERAVSKERLELYFDKVAGGYKINKAIRDLCLFSKHDVTSDPPFSKMDIVSCRNMLIYFAPILQQRVLPVFHYALNPGGFLFLGGSESPGVNSKQFKCVDKAHKIYSKINSSTSKTFRFPVSTYVPKIEAFPKITFKQAVGGNDFHKHTDNISLARYAPPSVVVNADLEILQFRGRTVPFLEPASGQPTSNLLKMAKVELLHDLRVTIRAAIKKNTAVRQENISFHVDRKRRTVSIEVIPVNPLAPPSERNFVVFFEEAASSPVSKRLKSHLVEKVRSTKRPSKNTQGKQGQWIDQLEKELSASKQSQQSLTEEFGATQEELTAANEELQSTNEELQSTNEELGTAKEEIQSSNEELTTVNDELQNRNSELNAISSDLVNLLNSAEIPILIVGNDHRIRRFTPKAERLFRLIPSDVGRRIGDIKTEFDLDFEAIITEVTESLRPLEKEVKDRQGRWTRLQIRPYKSIDNRIDGAVITLIDIESLKQQIKVAKKAQDYLTSVAETVRFPLVILDDQLRLRSANISFWEHFKLSHQITGKDFFATLEMQGDSSQEMRVLLTETLRVKKKIINVEMDCDFPHLGRRTLLISASLIEWMGEMAEENQESQAILLSFVDITERKRTEEDLVLEARKLKESEEQFRLLSNSIPQLCWMAKADGWILWYNQRWYDYTGTALEEMQGWGWENVHHPDHVERVLKFVSQAWKKDESWELTFPLKSKSGEWRWFLTRAVPVHDSEGKIARWFGTNTDVTDQLQTQEELKKTENALREALRSRDEFLTKEQEARAEAERANQTKDQFIATLSHELRTPLSSILSWSQLIQNQKIDPDKFKHGIKVIEQSAKFQGQLIDDLLDITRIRSGKLSLNFTEVNPSEPVGLSIEAVRSLAESKQIVIESEIKIQSEKVWGDRDRLQQIVWNLLTNAIKFSANGGVIRIHVEPVEEHGDKFVMFKVIDQGKGISPDFLPKLFERFSQADSSSIRAHGGLGLGLAIVRDLVQIQSGTVRAESEGIGKGATFTFLLPVKSGTVGITSEPTSPANQQTQEEVESADLAGLCVMVVEDDPSTLEVLIEALNSFGAKTLGCSTVVDALAAFEKFKPDVLVSDISMPGEDGYSLIRKIRNLGNGRCGDVPSLALTAYATAGDVKRALSAGFDSHMAKPFDSFRLGHVVAGLAKLRKRERS